MMMLIKSEMHEAAARERGRELVREKNDRRRRKARVTSAAFLDSPGKCGQISARDGRSGQGGAPPLLTGQGGRGYFLYRVRLSGRCKHYSPGHRG